MPAGEYRIEIAILDRSGDVDGWPKPRVKLAIAGMDTEGWYDLGKIMVE